MPIKLPKFDNATLKQERKPVHIAINASQVFEGWDEEKIKSEQIVDRYLNNLGEMMQYQVKHGLPVLTLSIDGSNKDLLESYKDFF